MTWRDTHCKYADAQVVLYFNDVREGGETVFTHMPGIDHHDLPDTKVPVGEVRKSLSSRFRGMRRRWGRWDTACRSCEHPNTVPRYVGPGLGWDSSGAARRSSSRDPPKTLRPFITRFALGCADLPVPTKTLWAL